MLRAAKDERARERNMCEIQNFNLNGFEIFIAATFSSVDIYLDIYKYLYWL